MIVTSYVFSGGRVNYENLARMEAAVGKEHLVLDVSCRKRGTSYYIVTDRWQKFTDEVVDEALLDRLMSYCDEFLVHAVDVEGKARGIGDGACSVARRLGKNTNHLRGRCRRIFRSGSIKDVRA